MGRLGNDNVTGVSTPHDIWPRSVRSAAEGYRGADIGLHRWDHASSTALEETSGVAGRSTVTERVEISTMRTSTKEHRSRLR